MCEKEMPLVSVVMPIYNARRFVAEAIESVLAQTHEHLELILIDDCSTDDTLQILQAYAQRDQRICIMVNEQNQGVARSRNRGILAAQGAYIALLDSDDAWEKTKLEKQLRLARDQDAEIVYGAVDFVDEKSRVIKTFHVPETTDYREMLTRCFFICSTVVIKAEILKAHPFRTEFYHEDYLLWTELLMLKAKAVGVTDVVAYYRQIAGSRSYSKVKAAFNRWKIYRKALHMSVWQSFVTFVGYAVGGVKKYYF